MSSTPLRDTVSRYQQSVEQENVTALPKFDSLAKFSILYRFLVQLHGVCWRFSNHDYHPTSLPCPIVTLSASPTSTNSLFMNFSLAVSNT